MGVSNVTLLALQPYVRPSSSINVAVYTAVYSAQIILRHVVVCFISKAKVLDHYKPEFISFFKL